MSLEPGIRYAHVCVADYECKHNTESGNTSPMNAFFRAL